MNRLGPEYDFKRDIPNTPIVREIDRVRQRDLWRSGAVGVCLVSVLLFSAWQHFQLLRHGYDIEQMEQDRASELQVTGIFDWSSRRCALCDGSSRSPRMS